MSKLVNMFKEFEEEKQEEIKPKKIVSKSIMTPEAIERPKIKILADRKKNKIQLANKIHKLLINDAKLPKNQQKILMEKYRSTIKDLELYVTR